MKRIPRRLFTEEFKIEARLGAENFAIMMPESTSAESMQIVWTLLQWLLKQK